MINAGSAAMKELTLSLKEAFSSVLICLHLNKTRRTIKTRRTRPGITPAANVLEVGVGFKYRYWRNLTDEAELPKPLLDRLQNVIGDQVERKLLSRIPKVLSRL